MLDFDTVIKRHSESLIQQIVEMWERDNNVRHENPLLLEDRWAHLISATNDNQAVVCSTPAPVAIN